MLKNHPMLMYALIYFAVISLISVVVTVYDKFASKRGMWRIPEATLLILAALGGSVLMFATMEMIRHKTRKIKFMFGIPAIIVAQVAVVVIILLSKGII